MSSHHRLFCDSLLFLVCLYVAFTRKRKNKDRKLTLENVSIRMQDGISLSKPRHHWHLSKLGHHWRYLSLATPALSKSSAILTLSKSPASLALYKAQQSQHYLKVRHPQHYLKTQQLWHYIGPNNPDTI